MDPVLLTKQSWANGFLLAFLQLSALVLVCYVVMIVRLFRRKERALGWLCALLNLMIGGGQVVGVLIGLIFGWMKARAWGIRTFMAFWTALFLLALLNLAALFVALQLSKSDWQDYLGWLPSF